MLKFVKPNAVLLMSERLIEDKIEENRYAYFDRAFIVTNDAGYHSLLTSAAEFFNDDSVGFFGDFIATKHIDYINSVQWGILEAFLRTAYERVSNGVCNIPHIVYDIYMNDTYRKYFPLMNFDKNILIENEDNMDKNTYDLLSFEDICNLDQDIALRHITVNIQLKCDRETHEHFFKNMDYRSCVSSQCNPERYIVPVEVINNGQFSVFKNACNTMYKVYKNLERDNYGVAKTLIPGSAERELIVEITLEHFISFMNRYVNQAMFMETMEVKTLCYLMFTLVKDTFGMFIGDKLDDILKFLAKDSDSIADALSVWNDLYYGI